MTIPEKSSSEAAESAAPLPPPRVTRPLLDRDAPVRNWSTLFGPSWGATPAGAESAKGSFATGVGTPGFSEAGAPVAGQTLSDAVGQGYRVINDYLAQGQRYAAAMKFPDWANLLQGSGPSHHNAALSNPEMQQLLRRVIQYGADFAGLWFEMWTRMGGPSSLAGMAAPGPFPPGSFPSGPFPPPESSDSARSGAARDATASPYPSGFERGASASEAGSSRVLMCITSERPTEAMLELRRGPAGTLIAHALRPEGHEGQAIRGVTIEVRQEDGTVRVALEVPPNQPAGIYNGMIVDPVSNLPRGTLTVKVGASAHG